jgi:hypothetical protein
MSPNLLRSMTRDDWCLGPDGLAKEDLVHKRSRLLCWRVFFLLKMWFTKNIQLEKRTRF